MDELENRLTILETTQKDLKETQKDIEFQLIEMRQEVKKTIGELSKKLDEYITIEHKRQGSETTIKTILNWLGVGSFVAIVTVAWNYFKGH